jgi:D-alanyl-D-alanine carboxypeptidase
MLAGCAVTTTSGDTATVDTPVAENYSDDVGEGVENTDTTPDQTTDTDTGTDATPPAPFEPQVIAALQAILDEHVVFSAEPGITVAIYSKEGAYWEGSAGIRQIQNADPMTPDSGFRVGSNTKTYFATITMLLAEEGALSLDDTLGKYLPEYTLWKDIRLRHLLGMQSGIPDYLGVAELMFARVMDPGAAVTPEEILSFVADKPLLYVPGVGANYSNSNYMLLGLILEKVTGKAPDVLLAERLTGPLGLEHTILDLTGEQRPDVSHGYMDMNLVGMIFGVPSSVLDFFPPEIIVEGTIVDSSYLFHPSLTWIAGALISTAHDMATFMRALLTGLILKPESLAMMQETKILQILGEDVAYGMGLRILPSPPYDDLIGHGGLNFGYQAATYLLPKEGIAFSHMHNFLPEQGDLFQNAMLGVLVDGKTEIASLCRPPEGFFDAVEPNTVLMRFKGPINGLDVTKAAPAIGSHSEQTGEKLVSLYGLGGKATLKKQGDQTRIEFESLAPGESKTAEVLVSTINIDPVWLDAITGTGDATTDLETTTAVWYTRSDLDLVDGTLDPVKMCVTTVRDATRPAVVHLCDADLFAATDGMQIRAFAKVPVTHDPATVTAALLAIGVPQCQCYSVAGTWEACP